MKRLVQVTCMAVVCALFLWGCTGVEAEKRAYPQVVAVDRMEGENLVIFGMPNMEASTGQDKSGGDNQASTLVFRGSNMKEVNKMYEETQEKYLDLGHVNVLILGSGILKNSMWEQMLAALKQEPTVGEDIYVFCTKDVEAVMDYNGNQVDSLGEYLLGIYENRPYHLQKKGVTLRQVYKTWYEKGELCNLPEIVISQQGYLQVKEENKNFIAAGNFK